MLFAKLAAAPRHSGLAANTKQIMRGHAQGVSERHEFAVTDRPRLDFYLCKNRPRDIPSGSKAQLPQFVLSDRFLVTQASNRRAAEIRWILHWSEQIASEGMGRREFVEFGLKIACVTEPGDDGTIARVRTPETVPTSPARRHRHNDSAPPVGDGNRKSKKAKNGFHSARVRRDQ